MPKRKKWADLSDAEKTEDLYRQVVDLQGAIQTIRLDLAHIVGKAKGPKDEKKKKKKKEKKEK